MKGGDSKGMAQQRKKNWHVKLSVMDVRIKIRWAAFFRPGCCSAFSVA